jgi:hypothetical protein
VAIVTVDPADQPKLQIPLLERVLVPTLVVPGGARVSVYLSADPATAAEWWSSLATLAGRAAAWHRDRSR